MTRFIFTVFIITLIPNVIWAEDCPALLQRAESFIPHPNLLANKLLNDIQPFMDSKSVRLSLDMQNMIEEIKERRIHDLENIREEQKNKPSLMSGRYSLKLSITTFPSIIIKTKTGKILKYPKDISFDWDFESQIVWSREKFLHFDIPKDISLDWNHELLFESQTTWNREKFLHFDIPLDSVHQMLSNKIYTLSQNLKEMGDIEIEKSRIEYLNIKARVMEYRPWTDSWKEWTDVFYPMNGKPFPLKYEVNFHNTNRIAYNLFENYFIIYTLNPVVFSY